MTTSVKNSYGAGLNAMVGRELCPIAGSGSTCSSWGYTCPGCSQASCFPDERYSGRCSSLDYITFVQTPAQYLMNSFGTTDTDCDTDAELAVNSLSNTSACYEYAVVAYSRPSLTPNPNHNPVYLCPNRNLVISDSTVTKSVT